MTTYSVTKQHTTGVLAGMVTTETTTVCFPVGLVVDPSIGGGAYTVVSVVGL